MFKNLSPHTSAILQALLVTFLWSTSWVLIKIGLEDIPALTFAGLRYMIAFLVLLPVGIRRGQLTVIRQLPRRDWLRLGLLGLLMYTFTQGAQFLALDYLPAVTLSLLLNLTSIIVALMGIVLLHEFPGTRQWAGIGIYLFGIFIYFAPAQIPAAEVTGMIVGLLGVMGNAGAAVFGRAVNRDVRLSALTVTLVSMGIGAVILLSAGILIQGLSAFSLTGWLIVLWLAVVNTAFAFTLWNHTLRVLSAIESSVINNTMLIQIGVLAWVFLGERITPVEGIGLIFAAVGIFIVQASRRSSRKTAVVAAHEIAEPGD